MYPRRTTKKLNVDSDEQQQKQKSEKTRMKNNIASAKQQFSRRQITDDSTQMEKNVIQQGQKREDNIDMSYLFKEDSDEDFKFQQVENNLQKLYPLFIRPMNANEKRSDQKVLPVTYHKNSNSQKKKKVIKNEESLTNEKRAQKVSSIKKEQNSQEKQKILRDFAVRWWYAYPQWPPKQQDYERKLLNLGYRMVQESRFKFQENIVNGLLKAAPINGFPGFFKAKNVTYKLYQKLLDLRPNDRCPSMKNFRQKSMQQLLQLLKIALKNQIKAISQKSYKTKDEIALRNDLRKLLESYSSF